MAERDYQFWVKLASSCTLLIVSTMILTKVWAWLATGSASMMGSLTDSLLDITASLMNFFVLRYALRPADDDHKFGHGKAESLAGLGQAAFIAGSACLLFFHGVERIYSPQLTLTPMIGVGVSAYAIFATLALVLLQQMVVKKTGSIAIKADSLHYRGDLLLNAGVMVALILASFDFFYADGIVAILVALYLLYNGWQIAIESADHLMDKELGEDEQKLIYDVACSHPQVHGVHELRTRQGGKTKFIQLHIELDDDILLMEAHHVSDQVEALIESKIEGELDILIHQDPMSVVDKN